MGAGRQRLMMRDRPSGRKQREPVYDGNLLVFTSNHSQLFYSSFWFWLISVCFREFMTCFLTKARKQICITVDKVPQEVSWPLTSFTPLACRLQMTFHMWSHPWGAFHPVWVKLELGLFIAVEICMQWKSLSKMILFDLVLRLSEMILFDCFYISRLKNLMSS